MSASAIYEDFAPLLNEVPAAYQPGCKAVLKQALLKQALEKALPDPSGNTQQCIIAGKTLCPIEYKVIVKPDHIDETDDVIKSAKAAGIQLPEQQLEKEKNRQISGTLVAVGGKAFEDMGNPMPKVGDKVYFAKYAGIVLESDNKDQFRMMNDKDVTGVLV